MSCSVEKAEVSWRLCCAAELGLQSHFRILATSRQYLQVSTPPHSCDAVAMHRCGTCLFPQTRSYCQVTAVHQGPSWHYRKSTSPRLSVLLEPHATCCSSVPWVAFGQVHRRSNNSIVSRVSIVSGTPAQGGRPSGLHGSRHRRLPVLLVSGLF